MHNTGCLNTTVQREAKFLPQRLGLVINQNTRVEAGYKSAKGSATLSR